ncbi:MAG: 1,4-dihydroxy-2-naphthoate octaprenyltransferase [Neisseriaceae bacterium]|nr:1,4-dihydroxy-2-naphthoate octaprenyltransferase [Neisseriaceae bacterium]
MFEKLNIIKIWLSVTRPKTLLLSIASIGLGNILAWHNGFFSYSIAILGIITAVSLQILANIANDYGDATHHADDERLGDIRLVSAGLITHKSIKIAIIINILFCIICGLSLIYIANVNWLIWIILGGVSIIAAITYTVGRNPYGYQGLGDLSVFFFFGIIAVCGIYILQTHSLPEKIFLPASAIGLWSVAVLNINNMRDIEQDKKHNKKTLAVRFGIEKSRLYHCFIIFLALLCWSIFAISQLGLIIGTILILFSIITFLLHIKRVMSNWDSKFLNNELKRLSISILLQPLFLLMILYLTKLLHLE